MKNCGRRFQKEVTRNHFLTNLFRIVWTEVSCLLETRDFLNLKRKLKRPCLFLPTIFKLQYLGNRTPPKVKKRIVELVCSWTAAFPNEKEFIKTFKALKSIGINKVVLETCLV